MSTLRCVVIMMSVILFITPLSLSDEKWVKSIEATDKWAASTCTDYLVTVACGTVKDYSDPVSLPAIISVGDSINYKDKKGKSRKFHVKAIKFFVYDKDVDFMWAGERYTARKGERICSLYDSPKAKISPDYISTIFIKGCHRIN